MADQHHDDKPAMGNQIAQDIPDIQEAIKYHWDVLQMLIGVDATTLANVSPPGPQRALFSYSDTDTITIGPGVYFHDGTTRQTVFWDADITFDFGSGGSNAASDDIDAGAVDIHYVYLDDSAIVTQASPELDADCFLNSKTAPSWSDAKHGWYNGSDRCIFAVVTNASNQIIEFYHDEDLVAFADAQDATGDGDIDTTWTDVTCTLPSFVGRALLEASGNVSGTNAIKLWAWRKNGQSGTGGHRFAHNYWNSVAEAVQATVLVDSSGIFEIVANASNAGTITIKCSGWFFPRGM